MSVLEAMQAMISELARPVSKPGAEVAAQPEDLHFSLQT